MIARYDSNAADRNSEDAWDRRPARERPGSLRRIDDILGELLAGYALAAEAPEMEDNAGANPPDPRRAVAGSPALPIAAAVPLDSALVETLAACPRSCGV